VLTIKKLYKNEYFMTALAIAIMIIFVVGFFYGAQVFLNTTNPLVTVESGSMCIEYYNTCDGWSHPFERTLHVGDVLIIQGLNPADYNSNYPDSDIIVFHPPGSSDPNFLVVHRLTSEKVEDEVYYFYVKGDGNPPDKWPAPAEPYAIDSSWYYKPDIRAWYASHPEVPEGAIPEEFVVGKVICRIPWIGQITLFMDPNRNPWGRPIIIGLIILLIVIEFILPLAKQGKRIADEQKDTGVQT
jgi:hypothetical protein